MVKVQNNIHIPLFMERGGGKGLDQDPDWSEVLVPQFHIELSVAVRFAGFKSSSGIKSTSLTVITSLT